MRALSLSRDYYNNNNGSPFAGATIHTMVVVEKTTGEFSLSRGTRDGSSQK